MPDSPRLPAIPEAAIAAMLAAQDIAAGADHYSALRLWSDLDAPGGHYRVRVARAMLEAAWPVLYAAAREHALNGAADKIEAIPPPDRTSSAYRTDTECHAAARGVQQAASVLRAFAADGSREDSHE